MIILLINWPNFVYLSVDPGFLTPIPKFLWSIALRPPMEWTPPRDTTDKQTDGRVSFSVCVSYGVRLLYHFSTCAIQVAVLLQYWTTAGIRSIPRRRWRNRVDRNQNVNLSRDNRSLPPTKVFVEPRLEPHKLRKGYWHPTWTLSFRIDFFGQADGVISGVYGTRTNRIMGFVQSADSAMGQVSQPAKWANSAFHPSGVGKWVYNACIYIDHGGSDHVNGRLGLRAAVWQHGSKSVCAGLSCCGLGWTAALSVATAPLKANLTFTFYLLWS